MIEKPRRKPARLLGHAAVGAAIVSAGLLALAYATPDSFAHSRGVLRRLFMLSFFVRTFEMHLGLALLMPLVILVALRRWMIAALILPVLAWTIGPLVASCLRPSNAILERPLRVMTANLLVGHSEVGALVAEINRFAPDVIFFQEYTPDKAAKLAYSLGKSYPFRVEGMRDHAFGEAIYSKVAFVSEPDLYPHQSIRSLGSLDGRAGGEAGIWDPQIRAVIEFEGSPIVLQNVHYAPPIHSSYLLEQRIMTKWLCDWLSQETRPVIIAGDFNCTTSSVNFSDLRRAGLSDSRSVASRGWAGTWPSSGLPSLLPVAIDHVLIRGLQCESSTPGGDIASDHLPLLVTVGLGPAK